MDTEHADINMPLDIWPENQKELKRRSGASSDAIVVCDPIIFYPLPHFWRGDVAQGDIGVQLWTKSTTTISWKLLICWVFCPEFWCSCDYWYLHIFQGGYSLQISLICGFSLFRCRDTFFSPSSGYNRRDRPGCSPRRRSELRQKSVKKGRKAKTAWPSAFPPSFPPFALTSSPAL